jgi:hypothetical protein
MMRFMRSSECFEAQFVKARADACAPFLVRMST